MALQSMNARAPQRAHARRAGEKWPPAEAGVHMRVGRRAGKHKNGGAFGLAPPECWIGLGGSRVLCGLCWRLCLGWLCSLSFVLGGKLLLDFGGDCGHVHLVELRGLA